MSILESISKPIVFYERKGSCHKSGCQRVDENMLSTAREPMIRNEIPPILPIIPPPMSDSRMMPGSPLGKSSRGSKKRRLMYDRSVIHAVVPNEGKTEGNDSVDVYFSISAEDYLGRFRNDGSNITEIVFGGVKSNSFGRIHRLRDDIDIDDAGMKLDQIRGYDTVLCELLDTSAECYVSCITPSHAPGVVDVGLLVGTSTNLEKKDAFEYKDLENRDRSEMNAVGVDSKRSGMQFVGEDGYEFFPEIYPNGEEPFDDNLMFDDDVVTYMDRFQANSLHYDSAKGRTERVDRLIDVYGLDPEEGDIFGVTPLDVASYFKQFETTFMMLEKDFAAFKFYVGDSSDEIKSFRFSSEMKLVHFVRNSLRKWDKETFKDIVDCRFSDFVIEVNSRVLEDVNEEMKVKDLELKDSDIVRLIPRRNASIDNGRRKKIGKDEKTSSKTKKSFRNRTRVFSALVLITSPIVIFYSSWGLTVFLIVLLVIILIVFFVLQKDSNPDDDFVSVPPDTSNNENEEGGDGKNLQISSSEPRERERERKIDEEEEEEEEEPDFLETPSQISEHQDDHWIPEDYLREFDDVMCCGKRITSEMNMLQLRSLKPFNIYSEVLGEILKEKKSGINKVGVLNRITGLLANCLQQNLTWNELNKIVAQKLSGTDQDKYLYTQTDLILGLIRNGAVSNKTKMYLFRNLFFLRQFVPLGYFSDRRKYVFDYASLLNLYKEGRFLFVFYTKTAYENAKAYSDIFKGGIGVQVNFNRNCHKSILEVFFADTSISSEEHTNVMVLHEDFLRCPIYEWLLANLSDKIMFLTTDSDILGEDSVAISSFNQTLQAVTEKKIGLDVGSHCIVTLDCSEGCVKKREIEGKNIPNHVVISSNDRNKEVYPEKVKSLLFDVKDKFSTRKRRREELPKKEYHLQKLLLVLRSVKNDDEYFENRDSIKNYVNVEFEKPSDTKIEILHQIIDILSGSTTVDEFFPLCELADERDKLKRDFMKRNVEENMKRMSIEGAHHTKMKILHKERLNHRVCHRLLNLYQEAIRTDEREDDGISTVFTIELYFEHFHPGQSLKFLRELSQRTKCNVYGIMKTLEFDRKQYFEDYDECKESLMTLYKHILLSGHSLQIVDRKSFESDVSDIIEVIKMCGLEGKKVVTVGILGEQTSGKSLILRCLFGTKQKIRGIERCTNGLQISIVQVADEPEKVLVVIDSEGILSDQERMECEGDDRLLDQMYDRMLPMLLQAISDVQILNLVTAFGKAINYVLEVASFCEKDLFGQCFRPYLIPILRKVKTKQGGVNFLGRFKKSVEKMQKVEGKENVKELNIMKNEEDEIVFEFDIRGDGFRDSLVLLLENIFGFFEKKDEFMTFECWLQNVKNLWEVLVMNRDFIMYASYVEKKIRDKMERDITSTRLNEIFPRWEVLAKMINDLNIDDNDSSFKSEQKKIQEGVYDFGSFVYTVNIFEKYEKEYRGLENVNIDGIVKEGKRDLEAYTKHLKRVLQESLDAKSDEFADQKELERKLTKVMDDNDVGKILDILEEAHMMKKKKLEFDVPSYWESKVFGHINECKSFSRILAPDYPFTMRNILRKEFTCIVEVIRRFVKNAEEGKDSNNIILRADEVLALSKCLTVGVGDIEMKNEYYLVYLKIIGDCCRSVSSEIAILFPEKSFEEVMEMSVVKSHEILKNFELANKNKCARNDKNLLFSIVCMDLSDKFCQITNEKRGERMKMMEKKYLDQVKKWKLIGKKVTNIENLLEVVLTECYKEIEEKVRKWAKGQVEIWSRGLDEKKPDPAKCHERAIKETLLKHRFFKFIRYIGDPESWIFDNVMMSHFEKQVDDLKRENERIAHEMEVYLQQFLMKVKVWMERFKNKAELEKKVEKDWCANLCNSLLSSIFDETHNNGSATRKESEEVEEVEGEGEEESDGDNRGGGEEREKKLEGVLGTKLFTYQPKKFSLSEELHLRSKRKIDTFCMERLDESDDDNEKFLSQSKGMDEERRVRIVLGILEKLNVLVGRLWRGIENCMKEVIRQANDEGSVSLRNFGRGRIMCSARCDQCHAPCTSSLKIHEHHRCDIHYNAFLSPVKSGYIPRNVLAKSISISSLLGLIGSVKDSKDSKVSDESSTSLSSLKEVVELHVSLASVEEDDFEESSEVGSLYPIVKPCLESWKFEMCRSDDVDVDWEIPKVEQNETISNALNSASIFFAEYIGNFTAARFVFPKTFLKAYNDDVWSLVLQNYFLTPLQRVVSVALDIREKKSEFESSPLCVLVDGREGSGVSTAMDVMRRTLKIVGLIENEEEFNVLDQTITPLEGKGVGDFLQEGIVLLVNFKQIHLADEERRNEVMKVWKEIVNEIKEKKLGKIYRVIAIMNNSDEDVVSDLSVFDFSTSTLTLQGKRMANMTLWWMKKKGFSTENLKKRELESLFRNIFPKGFGLSTLKKLVEDVSTYMSEKPKPSTTPIISNNDNNTPTETGEQEEEEKSKKLPEVTIQDFLEASKGYERNFDVAVGSIVGRENVVSVLRDVYSRKNHLEEKDLLFFLVGDDRTGKSFLGREIRSVLVGVFVLESEEMVILTPESSLNKKEDISLYLKERFWGEGGGPSRPGNGNGGVLLVRRADEFEVSNLSKILHFWEESKRNQSKRVCVVISGQDQVKMSEIVEKFEPLEDHVIKLGRLKIGEVFGVFVNRVMRMKEKFEELEGLWKKFDGFVRKVLVEISLRDEFLNDEFGPMESFVSGRLVCDYFQAYIHLSIRKNSEDFDKLLCSLKLIDINYWEKVILAAIQTVFDMKKERVSGDYEGKSRRLWRELEGLDGVEISELVSEEEEEQLAFSAIEKEGVEEWLKKYSLGIGVEPPCDGDSLYSALSGEMKRGKSANSLREEMVESLKNMYFRPSLMSGKPPCDVYYGSDWDVFLEDQGKEGAYPDSDENMFVLCCLAEMSSVDIIVFDLERKGVKMVFSPSSISGVPVVCLGFVPSKNYFVSIKRVIVEKDPMKQILQFLGGVVNKLEMLGNNVEGEESGDGDDICKEEDEVE